MSGNPRASLIDKSNAGKIHFDTSGGELGNHTVASDDPLCSTPELMFDVGGWE
jgi:hypothetical protein